MKKIIIYIEPANGLALPDLGHLAHGTHELEVSADQLDILQTAEGLRIDEAIAKPVSGTASNVTQIPTAKPGDVEVLAEAIREAFIQLDPQDKSLWTKSDKPKTEALEAVLGYNITASERDTAIPPGYDPS